MTFGETLKMQFWTENDVWINGMCWWEILMSYDSLI